MNELSIELKRIISKNGSITFKDFMQIALYHPVYGYYSKGRIPFGSRGDFVTSPHTHSLFGALIARQIVEFWEILGKGLFSIVEMGAGSGYLARDILNYLSMKDLLDQFIYWIVEPHEKTEAVQRMILEDFSENVQWKKNIQELEGIEGCILSNELLDAFPVHLLEKTEENFCEIYICLSGDGEFQEVKGSLSSDKLKRYVDTIPVDLPPGYRTEANLEIRDWIYQVSAVIRRGFVITIDYGHTRREYFHPARNKGTLLAYRNQRVSEDLLALPGEQDLTAHVNFTDLHLWGKEAGFETLGYTSQWAFLAGLDVESTLKELGDESSPFSQDRMAIKMLLLPQGMGESHKVLIQAKNIPKGIKLKGLSLRNIKTRLDT